MERKKQMTDKAAWTKCVIRRNATVWSEIFQLVNGKCGENLNTFCEINTDEMIHEEPVSDNYIINNVKDPTDDHEETDPMTKNSVYVGLQLWNNMKSYIVHINNNSGDL